MTAVLPARAPAPAPVPPPAAAAGQRAGRLRTAARLAGRWATRALIGLTALLFVGVAVGPHVLDYRTLTMLTASMSPTIDPGDVVLSTPLDVRDVTEGMVITYHIPVDDHRIVTHRVIDVEHAADGTVTVRTQGDANAAPDPWTAVLTGDTAYQMQAVVPELGHLITALRHPLLNRTLLYGAPALLAGWMLLTIWRPTRGTTDGHPDAESADAGPARC